MYGASGCHVRARQPGQPAVGVADWCEQRRSGGRARCQQRRRAGRAEAERMPSGAQAGWPRPGLACQPGYPGSPGRPASPLAGWLGCPGWPDSLYVRKIIISSKNDNCERRNGNCVQGTFKFVRQAVERNREGLGKVDFHGFFTFLVQNVHQTRYHVSTSQLC